jgi:hypothetical protein
LVLLWSAVVLLLQLVRLFVEGHMSVVVSVR